MVLLLVLLLYYSYNPSQSTLFPKCPFYSFTGLYCPGCGSQRAIHKFLHGDIFEGLKHNFIIMVLPMVLIYDWSVILFNKYSNQKIKNILHYSKVTYSIFIIILLFWILRNLSFYPFSILAP
ncbi:DUF2752 domain-containing protein [Confluentibacter citreus]|uniref:DUF2752 domain-containing protein n=1 Tax=Confluentibacter citreus TaxID=2007307 RepID=UPI0037445023